jgi:hypothetical protein
MRLITKASKDFFIDTCCAEGDLLFFAWTEDDTKPYGVIRKMAFTPGQVEQEVVMGFPTKNVADNVRIISPKKSEPSADRLDHLGYHWCGNYFVRKTFGVDQLGNICIRHTVL